MNGKIPRLDAINIGKIASERAPFLSQLISSATSLLGSVIALAALHGSDLKKWFLYVGTSMALQGVIRATLLETDLLLYGHVTKKNRSWSLLCSLLPFTLLLVVHLILDMKLSLLDLILVITSVLSLVQDKLRYELVRNDRLGVVLADATWCFLSIIGLLLVMTPVRHSPLTIYAILFFGPSISSVYLHSRRKLMSPQSMNPELKNVRRYIILQNLSILMFTFFTNLILTKYLSGELFYQFRLIQTVVSPIQSIGLAIWFSKIVHFDKDLKEYTQIFRKSRRLIIFAISYLFIFLLFILNGKSHSILNVDIIGLLAVMAAGIAPILNIGFYEVSLYIRSKQLNFQTFKVGLLVLPFTPIFYFVLKSQLSLGAIFGIPLAAMIIQQSAYLLIFRNSLNRDLLVTKGSV